MKQAAMYFPQPMANSHRFLIGPPLIVVSLFCFAFVLMQPHGTAPAAVNHSAPAAGSAASLPPLPYASPSDLTKLTPAPAAGSPATTTPAPAPTLSPIASQASNTGATNSLQAAGSNNNQSSDVNSKPLQSTVKSLVNNLQVTK